MDTAMQRTSEQDIPESTRLQFEKGYLWEDVLSVAFGDKMAERPEEIELDGVHMSPDGINYDTPNAPILEEYKCTLGSSKKSPAENWKWMMQVKGYCKGIGATVCIFRIFHIKGDYTDGSPQYKVWELRFTPEELDENWRAVMNQVKAMEGEEI